MPGLITHLLCGQAVTKEVDDDLKRIIKKYPESYNLGTQGPDIFFYYLPGFLNKNTLNLGLLLHKNNTRDYILAMIDTASTLSGEEKEIAIAYISGYLTHYSLDSNTHPYIYYRTGVRKKGDKVKALKYSLYHRKFETAIDVLLLKSFSGKKPADRALWEFLNIQDKQEIVLGKVISRSLYLAYGRNISEKRVAKILKYIVVGTRLLQSKTGKRKKVMELIEDLTIGEHVYSSLIHEQVVTDNIDYLNMNKDSWHSPWDDEVKNQDNFLELYNKGMKDSVKFINATYSYLNNAIDIDDLSYILENRSMASGDDCSMPHVLKKHKVIFE